MLQIKVKFMAKAELESKLSGFQIITQIGSPTQKAVKVFWFQVFLSIWVRKMGHNSERKAYPGNSGKIKEKK